jgi:demethylmenaquinone methyltransferase/2-methoxy-6-polyprenyl-1,4-benzoquinol methylase
MVNKYYASGADRANRVNDLFARIAPRYDLINDLQSFGLHRLWKRRLVRLAALQPGHSALDLCCGTGDVAIALARAGAKVEGLDFSAPMLAVAQQRRNKLKDNGLDPVALPQFQQGDALKTPFADNTFDAVTVSYGLRNLADFRGGILEMLRVTKPGGRILVLDFGKPDNALWRWLYFNYLRVFVPIFGKLFCGDAATHAYILESLLKYPAQRGVATMMTELGCSNVEVHNLLGGIMSINVGVKAR